MPDLTSPPKTSVCFIAFDAAPVIFPDAKGAIGGAETRAILMVRALGRSGEFSVVVVVRDSENRPAKTIDGVRVVTWVDRLFRIRREVSEHVSVQPSFPWLNIRTWVPQLTWQIPLLTVARFFRKNAVAREAFEELLPAIDCDVYCCLGVSHRSSRIFYAARQQNHRTVLFIAANSDLDSRYVTEPAFQNCAGDSSPSCAAAIRDADLIVCQTEIQQKLLKDNFGRESCLLPNPFEYDDWQRKLQTLAKPAIVRSDRYALWIGRSDRHHKRPQILFSIARQCREISFVMIMNTQEESVAKELLESCPANVQIIECVPWSEMPGWFRSAVMFISTGSREFEGFPNVFLQSAASGVPIVSLEVDPGFLSEFNAGIVCNGDAELMMSEIRLLWSNNQRAKTLGQNGRNYMNQRQLEFNSGERLKGIIQSILN